MQNKRIRLHLTPKLTKQEMDDVFVEFYMLGEILEEESNTYKIIS